MSPFVYYVFVSFNCSCIHPSIRPSIRPSVYYVFHFHAAPRFATPRRAIWVDVGFDGLVAAIR
eukprot:8389297-Lingulodinium_polyedra.AAC.1